MVEEGEFYLAFEIHLLERWQRCHLVSLLHQSCVKSPATYLSLHRTLLVVSLRYAFSPNQRVWGSELQSRIQSARLRWGSFGLQSPLYGFWIIGNNPEIGPSSLVRLTASLLPISQSAQWNAKARGKFFLRQVQGTTQSFDARYTTSVLSLLLCHRTGIRITYSSSMDLLVCHKPHRHIIIRKWHLSAIIQYFYNCAIS